MIDLSGAVLSILFSKGILPKSETLTLVISISYSGLTRGPTLGKNLLRQQGPLS